MRILIASGIYPPDIGGPAQYARNLYETWKKAGHDVKVAAYRWERAAPPGLRHLLYLTKIWRKGWNADLILVLDTWSAAVPTMLACKLMGRRYVIRTGGDYLWEAYVERTGQPVLFRNFYETKMPFLTWKEKLIHSWGGAALRKASAVIFSTDWQRQIFEKEYKLNSKTNFIVENYCGPRMEATVPDGRVFLASTRELKWKNLDLLRRSFKQAQEMLKGRGMDDISLDTGKAMYENFLERMRRSYAVLLVSLGDISPNMIFDAIRVGVPFIVTEEVGTKERIKDVAVFVDPLNEKDIAQKIAWMSDPANRKAQAEKVKAFGWTHTWEQIGDEIVNVWKRVGGKRAAKAEARAAKRSAKGL